MRFVKSLSILLFLTVISVSVYSASKLFDGYYIDKNGDSVLCKIEFTDWTYNPKNIQVMVGNERRTLGTSDIKGFGVFGYSDYKTASVTYHTNPISTTGPLPEEFSEKQVTTDCFLKIIINGAYSLYELVIPERPYYFFSSNDSTVTELVFRVKQTDLQIAEDLQYKNTLSGLFLNEGILSQNQYAINNCGYNKSSFESMVRKLDEKHSGITQKKIKTKLLQLDLVVGGIMSNFPTSFDGRYSVNNKFSSSFSPSAGLNLFFIFPNRFKSIAAGISTEYYQYSSSVSKSGAISDTMSANFYYTTTYTEKLSTANSLIMTNFYGMYFINPFGSTRFYIKAGASVNISIKKDNSIKSDYTASKTGVQNGNIPISEFGQGKADVITVSKTFVTFNGSAGLMSGRSKLELNYYYSPTQMSLTDSNPFKIGMLGLHYYYTVFR